MVACHKARVRACWSWRKPRAVRPLAESIHHPHANGTTRCVGSGGFPDRCRRCAGGPDRTDPRPPRAPRSSPRPRRPTRLHRDRRRAARRHLLADADHVLPTWAEGLWALPDVGRQRPLADAGRHFAPGPADRVGAGPEPARGSHRQPARGDGTRRWCGRYRPGQEGAGTYASSPSRYRGAPGHGRGHPGRRLRGAGRGPGGAPRAGVTSGPPLALRANGSIGLRSNWASPRRSSRARPARKASSFRRAGGAARAVSPGASVTADARGTGRRLPGRSAR